MTRQLRDATKKFMSSVPFCAFLFFHFYILKLIFLSVPTQLSSQYELWAEQLQNADIPRDLKDTEAQLRNLGEHINHIQTTTFEVAQRGQDLLQVRVT